MKTTFNTNPWSVPSVQHCFDGVILGRPSQEERQKLIEDTIKARSVWKPSTEALSLFEQLKYYIGRRVYIEFWDPIMYMLDDEGPFPIEANCVDLIILEKETFHQAYLVINEIHVISKPLGYAPKGYLTDQENTKNKLASVSDLYEINIA